MYAAFNRQTGKYTKSRTQLALSHRDTHVSECMYMCLCVCVWTEAFVPFLTWCKLFTPHFFGASKQKLARVLAVSQK